MNKTINLREYFPRYSSMSQKERTIFRLNNSDGSFTYYPSSYDLPLNIRDIFSTEKRLENRIKYGKNADIDTISKDGRISNPINGPVLILKGPIEGSFIIRPKKD
jgi:hypothetical protein